MDPVTGHRCEFEILAHNARYWCLQRAQLYLPYSEDTPVVFTGNVCSLVLRSVEQASIHMSHVNQCDPLIYIWGVWFSDLSAKWLHCPSCVLYNSAEERDNTIRGWCQNKKPLAKSLGRYSSVPKTFPPHLVRAAFVLISF